MSQLGNQVLNNGIAMTKLDRDVIQSKNSGATQRSSVNGRSKENWKSLQ